MEAGRFPISVRLVGVMHKEKKKLYMTSVLWSDQNDIVVYRGFTEFKTVHTQLKRAFPPANKLKKSDRVIPRFRDKKLKQSSPRNGPNKSMVTLRFLQEYCNELLSCGPQVTRYPDLIQFFKPNGQDLQPEFAKHSIVIMPSEDEIRSNVSGNVTQPFVTETYRCVATYETKDTKNKPFKVAVDDKVDVLIKDKAGWWLVENEDKRMAWFPAPYLEKLDDDDDDDDDDRDEDEVDGTPERGMLYSAVKSYKATKVDEITVNIGAVVEVMQKSESGWWLIRYNGKVGYIPTMYLKPYSYPNIRLTPLHQDSRSLSPLLVPSSGPLQKSQLSRSQGNLLNPPPARSSSPLQIQPESKQRSLSLEILSEQPTPHPRPPHPPPPPPPPPPPAAQSTADTAAPAANVATTSNATQQGPLPTITVEMNEGEVEGGGLLRADSEASFASDSTDFSFSDDNSFSSTSSSLNLSISANDERLRFSRTPPPMSSNRLSPTSGPEGRLIPSVSDPNLYKRPISPQVPPRPRAQEILVRCTSVTRKNASKGGLSPTQPGIIGR